MHGANDLPSRIPDQIFPFVILLVRHHCCLSPPKTPFRLKGQAATFGLAHRHSHGCPCTAPQMIRRANRLTYAIRILLLNHKQSEPARVYWLLPVTVLHPPFFRSSTLRADLASKRTSAAIETYLTPPAAQQPIRRHPTTELPPPPPKFPPTDALLPTSWRHRNVGSSALSAFVFAREAGMICKSLGSSCSRKVEPPFRAPAARAKKCRKSKASLCVVW